MDPLPIKALTMLHAPAEFWKAVKGLSKLPRRESMPMEEWRAPASEAEQELHQMLDESRKKGEHEPR